MPTARKTAPKSKKVAVKKTVKKAVLKAKKTTAKKTKSTKTTTKVTKKKTAKKATKKAVAKTPNKSIKSKDKKNAGVVSLPDKVNEEMIEKVVATEHFLETLRIPVYRIAYVSAFCFMLVGMMAVVSAYVTPQQYAQVSCSGLVCDDGTGDSSGNGSDGSGGGDNNEPGTTPLPAIFDLLEPLPNLLLGEVVIPMRVENAFSFDIEIINLDTGDDHNGRLESLSDENYRLVLREQDFEQGLHQVEAEVEDEFGIRLIPLGTFFVEQHYEDEFDGDADTDTGNQDEESDTAADGSVPEEDEDATNEEETDAAGVANSVEEADEVTEEDENPFVPPILTEPDLPNVQPEVDSEEIEDSEVEEIVFEIISGSDVWSGREVVKAKAPLGYRNVELYVRPQSGLQARFLGRMSNRNDEWQYIFDSNNLPNGIYELFATASLDNQLVTSDSIVVSVDNYVSEITTDNLNTDDGSTTTSDRPSIPRPFYEVEDENSDESEPEKLAAREVQEILTNNVDDINELIKRYAVARQSDSPLLLEAAEKEIENKRKALIREVLSESDGQESTSQIEIELNIKIEDIKNRVNAFEDVRRSRLDETVRNDSDGDGVSDFDEINVYKTNPNSADSDGDGFIDGAEIVRGFDPTNSAAEAIVEYELPTEVVGLEREDVLEVTEVKSVVEEDEKQNPTAITAEIRGSGLPNSFVTLYVFSSPVIVTVKTDEDGSFVYRFDKELEDGSHEVYVAFTDNTGSILAQSKPFTFVKEAQAFSPVDSETEIQPKTAPTVVESSTIDAVQFVLAITIIVLGFFLLMLGINLRETAPKIVEETESV